MTESLEPPSENPPLSTGLSIRLLQGASWSFLGAAISQGSAMLAGILTARIIGQQAFGSLGIIQNTTGMLGTFAGLGLAMAATKYIAELRWTDPSRAVRIAAITLITAFLSGTVAGIILYVSAPWLINDPKLAPQLRIASVLLLASTVAGGQAGALTGLEAFRAIAQAGAVRGALTLLIAVIAARFWGLNGAVWALSISALLGCCVNHVAWRRSSRQAGLPPLGIRGIWHEWPLLSHFSVPAWLSAAMVAPVTWAACVILINTSGYGEMGIFNAANQWRAAALFVPGVISQPLLPIFADLYSRRAAGCSQLLWRSLAGVGALSVLTAVPVCLLSPQIMGFYGGRFRDSWPVLLMLAASTIPAACCAVIGQVLAACGRLWTGFAMNLMWAAVLLGVTLGSGESGARGLAGAFLISYLFHAVVVTFYTLAVIRRIAPSPSPSLDCA